LITLEELEALERANKGQQTVIVVSDAAAKYRECLAYCARYKVRGEKPGRVYAVHWLIAYHGDGICFVISTKQLPDALAGLTFRYAAVSDSVSAHDRELVLARVIE
jgi:hypothetical protein